MLLMCNIDKTNPHLVTKPLVAHGRGGRKVFRAARLRSSDAFTKNVEM